MQLCWVLVAAVLLDACSGKADRDLEVGPATIVSAPGERALPGITPEIAVTATDTIIAWQAERDSDETDMRIHARVLGRDGLPRGNVIALAPGHYPTSTVFAGGVVVAWARSTPEGDVLGYAVLPSPATPFMVPSFIVGGMLAVGGSERRVDVATCRDDRTVAVLQDLLHDPKPTVLHPPDGCDLLAWVADRGRTFLVARRRNPPSTEVFAQSAGGLSPIAYYPARCELVPDIEARCTELPGPGNGKLVKTPSGLVAMVMSDRDDGTTQLVATGLDPSLKPRTRSTTVLAGGTWARFEATTADDTVLVSYIEDNQVLLRTIIDKP